ACLRHAFPVVRLDLGPGETFSLPESWPDNVPLGIVLGRKGGLVGELAADAVTLTIDTPDLRSRRAHWQRSLGSACDATVEEIGSRHRLAAGQIYRVARLARMRAVLGNRQQPSSDDVSEALRTLNRESLDALATRLVAEGDWSR